MRDGARMMLVQLVNEHPGWLSHSELGARCVMDPNGDTFGACLFDLLSRKLVDVDMDQGLVRVSNHARASDALRASQGCMAFRLGGPDHPPYLCKEPADHADDHVVRNPDGTVLASWPRAQT